MKIFKSYFAGLVEKNFYATVSRTQPGADIYNLHLRILIFFVDSATFQCANYLSARILLKHDVLVPQFLK
jgi:hypothetical protein